MNIAAYFQPRKRLQNTVVESDSSPVHLSSLTRRWRRLHRAGQRGRSKSRWFPRTSPRSWLVRLACWSWRTRKIRFARRFRRIRWPGPSLKRCATIICMSFCGCLKVGKVITVHYLLEMVLLSIGYSRSDKTNIVNACKRMNQKWTQGRD